MWEWQGQESVRKGGRGGSDEEMCDYVILICPPIGRIFTSLNIRVCFHPHRTLRQLLVQLKTTPQLRREQELTTGSPVGYAAKHTLGKLAGHWTNG